MIKHDDGRMRNESWNLSLYLSSGDEELSLVLSLNQN